MLITDIDVSGIIGALQAMVVPPGLKACGLIVDYDPEQEAFLAYVALILDFPEWNDGTVEACEAARSAAATALINFAVTPITLCRTPHEHAELRQHEPAWAPIYGDC